jgi:carboxymethylenebutenolidase
VLPSGDPPWPGLIVIKEWWGLDPQTTSIADRFVCIGYLAFAPDLNHGDQAKLREGLKAVLV